MFGFGHKDDDAGRAWEDRCDECVRQIDLALTVADSIIRELEKMKDRVDDLRRVPEKYADEEQRSDLKMLAEKFRDAFGRELTKMTASLHIAFSESNSVDNILMGFK